MGRADPAPRELIEKLRVFAKRLLEAEIGLRSVVLFGSYARGNWLRDSDVDVIIVADGFKNKPFYEREYVTSKLWNYDYALEPWCYTSEEVEEVLKDRPRIDLVDALENGIVIYDDGFWKGIRSRYLSRPYRRSRYGGVVLEDRAVGQR